MSKNSLKLELTGVEELLQSIEKMGGDINQAAEKAILASAKPFHQELKLAIKKHRRSGLTEATLHEPTKVHWEGNRCSLQVGFNLKAGGLPALFLEYGTPRMKARPFIRPAINRSRKNMKAIQQKTLSELLKEITP
jgi:HK97 gp10 family phage protein